MEQSTQPQQSPAPQPVVVKKQNGLFALLGKIFLFLLIAAGLLGGGYYFGTQGTKKAEMKSQQKTVVVTATSTPIPASPTAASLNTKTVKAGLANKSTSFKPYSIQIPTGWIDARENTEAAGIDKLTITKEGYSLTVYQAAFGGGGCTYKGDPPAEMAQSFTDFADIAGKEGAYRRSWNLVPAAKTISYNVCQKAADNSYGSLTSFGSIAVVSPNPANAATLAEIDGMIASISKQ